MSSCILCMHKYSCVSISKRNLKCLTSPIPKIWLGINLKKWSRDPDQAHPGVVLSSLDIFYLPAKFGDFRFSRSAAMISGIKTENASCNTNHAPLRLICHLYAGTWHIKGLQNLTTLASAVPEIWLVPTKNLNGSRELTTPLSGMICHPWTTINWSTKFEFSYSSHYGDANGNTKHRKCGGSG